MGEVKWHEVMKKVETIKDSLRYAFVRECYPLTWQEIAGYAVRQIKSDPNHHYDSYADFLVPQFQKIEEAGYKDLLDLALRLTTQESVVITAQACSMTLEEFNGVLNYLAYWLLPRNFYLRDLIRKGDKQAGEYCAALRKCGYPNSLDLLERARTRAARQSLSAQTGIPGEALLDFVHRADFSRQGHGPNMVNNFINSGFPTVESLVNADLDDLTEKMTFYLASLGKVPKYGMDLPAAHAAAKVVPLVVEGE